MADLCNPIGDGADLFDVIIYTDGTAAQGGAVNGNEKMPCLRERV